MSGLSQLGFSIGEQKTIHSLLDKADIANFAAKVNVVVDAKKNKTEERTIVVGKLRLYDITHKGKLDQQAHYVEFIEIQSSSPTQVSIKMKNFVITIPDYAEVETLIRNLYTSIVTVFPGMKDNFPFVGLSEERISKLKSISFPEALCGGFIDSYKAICDYFSNNPLDDIIWDMSNLYVWNDITEFNLMELQMRKDPLRPQDWRNLLKALNHNTWFTSLIAESLVLEKEVFPCIAEVFQFNVTIQELTIRDMKASYQFFNSLASSWELNPNTNVQQIDFSSNEMEDKGMISLASAFGGFKKGIKRLNLSQNNIGIKGMAALAKALSGIHANTLESLSIAYNKLDIEVTRAFSTLFASTQNLTHLNLAFTNVEYQQLKKCENLTSLNISGNKIVTKDSKHLDLFQFLKHAPKIKKLILTNTLIPSEILKGLIESIPSIEALDLTETGLGDSGILTLTEALHGNKTLKTLIINANFEKKSKQRAKVLSALELLVSEKETAIEELFMAGGPKAQLKDDLVPFIFSLMTNTKLKTLDVSRNQSGNRLGMAFGKALSTNSTLQKLFWDENGVGYLGYQYFRNGILKNDTLSHMPLPLHDIVSYIKQNEKSALPELIKDIEQKIFQNCSREKIVEKNAQSKNSSPYVSRERSDSRVTRDVPKSKQHRVKPQGIDTQHASVLFGQLNEVLSQAQESGEITEEEAELLKGKKK